ncbi:MAG: hypothetical protein IMW85_08965, partial [Thermicanus sp.]|nr:hypothetical protein [Thermicanus sp.]
FRPATPPIDWRGLADRLLRYLIGRPEGITERNEKGNFHFTAFMEGRGHELITNGGLWMGLALRGERIDPYLPSLLDYFNEEIGIFMNGEKDTQSEYWYLMLVNALAAQLVKHSFQGNKNAVDKVRLSLKRIMKLAQDVNYDFNDQGYDFANGKPFTLREEYRQPDAIGGYAYLMELGFELFHDLEFREEALRAIHLYQSFERNPWYEIPSQAMACLAAARLYAQGEEINLEKILRFALDFEEGSLLVGVWGHQEIYGLMRGWRGFSRQESSRMAYSLESFILLPYLLPVVRYEPRFAEAIASYALHLSANARLFFSDFMKDKAQSRPDLGVEIPYEALHREEKGEIPYATGDFYGHRPFMAGPIPCGLAN